MKKQNYYKDKHEYYNELKTDIFINISWKDHRAEKNILIGKLELLRDLFLISPEEYNYILESKYNLNYHKKVNEILERIREPLLKTAETNINFITTDIHGEYIYPEEAKDEII